MAAYVIRSADFDEDADDIERIENAVELPRCTYQNAWWWLAFFADEPIAYLGLVPGVRYPNSAYLTRVGVLTPHRGNRLQARLMRVAERFARRQGFESIVSDTSDNPHSANNFIRTGYHIFQPAKPWAFVNTIYWRKYL